MRSLVGVARITPGESFLTMFARERLISCVRAFVFPKIVTFEEFHVAKGACEWFNTRMPCLMVFKGSITGETLVAYLTVTSRLLVGWIITAPHFMSLQILLCRVSLFTKCAFPFRPVLQFFHTHFFMNWHAIFPKAVFTTVSARVKLSFYWILLIEQLAF